MVNRLQLSTPITFQPSADLRSQFPALARRYVPSLCVIFGSGTQTSPRAFALFRDCSRFHGYFNPERVLNGLEITKLQNFLLLTSAGIAPFDPNESEQSLEHGEL